MIKTLHNQADQQQMLYQSLVYLINQARRHSAFSHSDINISFIKHMQLSSTYSAMKGRFYAH